ncbi:MAG: hypothetical protein KBG39_08440 [Opitutaceae bacterium]|jgi:hypothetical protein|nr:hypothetical protein [Opitutaceae bacterium]HOD46654.1 hypothetical protein [Opitutaceae bacterium]HOG92336.1 hypothetical protein [Opitutaceae bacterium]HQL21211.1 hypothetical protein [Opitutaceae bacterium]
MSDDTPRFIVSDKCIAFSQTLLTNRRTVHTDQDAVGTGNTLFDWFDSNGALTAERAPIAARCIELGITLLKNSTSATADIVEQVKSAYMHYAR